MSDDHYLKKELYQRVHDNPKLFEWIEQGSLDGLWYWDLKNPEQEWLSPQFMKTFGYEPGEIPHTSQWWQENIFKEDLPAVLENFDKHCADPNYPYDQVVRYRSKTGATVWVRCRGLVIFDNENKPERMIGAHTDVTPLMQTKIELENTAAQLSRSNQELSSFAYAASHDLKAPLRSIRQLATWIEEDASDVNQETAENFRLLQDRVTRMDNLLDSLLEYSRLEHNAKQAREPVDTAALTKELFLFQNPPDEFNLITDDELPIIKTIKTPFEQVLRNLIGNAIKHRLKDDDLVAVWCEQDKTQYRFYIGDNSEVIPEKFENTIFEMFKTLKPKDQIEGSGMGLAMTKKIVLQQGGDISIINNSQNDDKTTLPYNCTKAFVFTWRKYK